MDGRALAARYAEHLVLPTLREHLPEVRYAVARLGSGSEILGLDDERSRDHDFGLRVNVLVGAEHVEPVRELLLAELPEEFEGWPTRFVTTWSPGVDLRVEVDTVAGFVTSRLGFDAADDLDLHQLLSLTGQSVLEVTAGPVFVDQGGELTATRDRLSWYPDDLWRHLVACDWAQAGEELPFIGRSGERGDDLGSRVIAARLAQVAMHLGFLLERRWPPYAKWFGTVFASLPRASAALAGLQDALAAPEWQGREAGLVQAFTVLGELQGEVGLPTASPIAVPFFDRPFQGLADVASLIQDSITDQQVLALPPGVGGIDQISSTTRVLVDQAVRQRMVTGHRRG